LAVLAVLRPLQEAEAEGFTIAVLITIMSADRVDAGGAQGCARNSLPAFFT